MAKRRVYLTFDEDTMTRPLVYEVGHKYAVVTNIRGASISKDLGLMALELEGDEGEIESALEWLGSEGVKIEPIEKNIIE